MTKYKTTTLSMAIHLEGESPIFGESSVAAKLDDEAGGMFLIIGDGDGSSIKIDIDQWDALSKVVKTLTSQKCEGM